MTGAVEFSGVFTVLPTAFHDDAALDLDGTRRLAGAAVAAGARGLTVLGVMGEAAELSAEERDAVLRTVRETVDLPTVVGVTSGTTDEVRQRSVRAADLGAAALMVSALPSLPLAEALAAAAAPGLPLVVQDYPSWSGVTLTVTDVADSCRQEPLVQAVKVETLPAASRISAMAGACPGLALLGGLGGVFLADELRAGSAGTMTGFAFPEGLVRVIGLSRQDPDAAEAAWEELLPLLRFEAVGAIALAARKEVWRLRGVISSATCRRPGGELRDADREAVRRSFERVSRVLNISPGAAVAAR